MIYVFHVRTIPVHTEDELEFMADSLKEAVFLLKHYIRSKFPRVKVVVSYFYLRVGDDSMALGEFTRDYYVKHFQEFQ